MRFEPQTGAEKMMTTEKRAGGALEMRNTKGLGITLHTSKGGHVATVYSAAGAPVLAAAPELLEALRDLLADVEEHASRRYCGHSKALAARAAIAKATAA